MNITKFANCQLKPDENLEHFVDFTDIKYEINADGLCDVVHAKYYIPTILTSDKLVRNFRFKTFSFIVNSKSCAIFFYV